MARPSRYPEEFRREAVQLALASDTSWASVARRLGVNETTLRNWVHAHLAEEARAADPLKVSPFGVRGVAPAPGGERRVEGGEGDPA
jgi:transposase